MKDEAKIAVATPLPVSDRPRAEILSRYVSSNRGRGLLLCLALYPPGASLSSDVGMDKHVSSAGSDFQLWDLGI